MRLSHEIIVLDYGDEQTSPFEDQEERDMVAKAEKTKVNVENGEKRIKKGCVVEFLFFFMQDKPVTSPF